MDEKVYKVVLSGSIDELVKLGEEYVNMLNQTTLFTRISRFWYGYFGWTGLAARKWFALTNPLPTVVCFEILLKQITTLDSSPFENFTKMFTSPTQIPSTLTLTLILTLHLSKIPFVTPQSNNLICEIHEMKLKITHLESILEKSIQSLDTELHHLAEKSKLIEEMTKTVGFLHTVLADLKVDSAYTDERINKLEEEVKLLWAASRKNNFDIHLLESKVQNTDGTIHAIISKVRKMQDIVTEQWIQIQQLDQALKITEMRSLEVQRKASSDRCTFLKFIRENILSSKILSNTYFSPALHQLRNTMKTMKIYHHEVQGYVKDTMEMNEFTAAFANQEIVFFVASVLIMLLLWVGFMVILSYYS